MTRHRIGAGLALAGALTLTGCAASDGDPTPPTGGKVEITFVGTDPAEDLAPLLEAFMAEREDIAVNYENIPFDQYDNVIQQRVGGGDAGIDVLLVDAGAAAAYASRGLIVDLTDDLAEAQASSIPAAVEQSWWQDKLWALPFWTSATYLFTNKDLVEAAGLEPPTAAGERWTWEEVVDAAGRAQAAGAEYGLLFEQVDLYYQMQPLVESAGGGSGAKGADLLTADLANPGWIEALEWYGQLFADGVSPRGVDANQTANLFAAGQAAFFIGGPWAIYTLTEPERPIDYTVAANPYFKGGSPAMATGSWSIAVSSSSDAAEAAHAFVRFASLTTPGNAASVARIIIPPTNQAAFDDFIARIDQADAPHTAGMGELTLSELRQAAVNRPNTVGFTQLTDVVGRASSDIRNGSAVEPTLRRAQAELQSLWDRL
ncbi:MAG: extracellular solute-binding protein [Propionibacteriaceae bacterium]|jgi:multiple sugar transport system substrate-binding protein|nr:extracellular solute-binding protein [Propionibacteriaceae bacterium]